MLLTHVHAVRKDGFASYKAVVLVNTKIIPSLEKCLYQIDFLTVLAEVSVNVGSGVFPGELARELKLKVGGRWSKARRYGVSAAKM
jgi:hypothetical protein